MSSLSKYKNLSEQQMKRSNSTSSLWTETNITTPKLSDIISSVSTMLHCQIMSDVDAPKPATELEYFLEETFTNVEVTKLPSLKDIYLFLKNVFEVGQFNPECCIICLIYVLLIAT